MSSEIMAFLSMIGTLVLVIMVFVGAYFATKLVGKRYQNLGPSMKDGMELIDRRAVGKEENLLIVRAGERVFLIGATPYYIGKIEELDGSLFPKLSEGEQKIDTSFYSVWKDVLKRKDFRGDDKDAK